MTLRLAATAALVLTVACGGSNDSSAAPGVTASTASPPAPASDGTSSVTGTLAPSLGPASTLIVLEPQDGTPLPVTPEPAMMDQSGYEFLPAFLIAQAGQMVQCRNSEDVLHNVRVTDAASQKPVFNVATTAFGRYEHTFDAGYYTVTCDIHPTMRASILVTASPYTATTAADGSFSISNVRPGQYNLTIYAGGAPVTRPLDVKDSWTDLGLIQ